MLANQPLSLKKVNTNYWTRQETTDNLDSPTRKSTEFGAESLKGGAQSVSASSHVFKNYKQKKKQLQANILKSYGTVQNPQIIHPDSSAEPSKLSSYKETRKNSKSPEKSDEPEFADEDASLKDVANPDLINKIKDIEYKARVQKENLQELDRKDPIMQQLIC